MKRTEDVLGEVALERVTQDATWGEQNHPNGTGEEYADLAERARTICDMAHQEGVGTWSQILLEETLEACAEADPRKLRSELVQVAAVAVAWIEAIDRKAAREEECAPTVRAPEGYPVAS